MDDKPLFVLPNRKCGKVRQGLYLISRTSPNGTLLPFTALVAPFEAYIANARSYQVVDIPSTLANLSLTLDSDLEASHNLPKKGLADLWGMSTGYKEVQDVIEETMLKGVSRRVAAIPDIEFPCPVLMMHMHAVLDIPDPERAWKWLNDKTGWEPYIEFAFPDMTDAPTVYVDSRPWLDAESLGHVGDDTYLWHAYAALYELIPQLQKDDLWDWFMEWFCIEYRPGVFGLSWITHAAYVLGPGETEVPAKWADRAVPAVGESDPRAVDGIPILED